MVHGIYFKTKPKNRWQLFSIAISPEAAVKEVNDCKLQISSQGNDKAEVAVQIFETIFYIPEYMNDLINQPILYN